MSPNAALLLDLLDLAPELERLSGEGWAALSEELLALAGRLEQEGDTAALGLDIATLLKRVSKTGPPELTSLVKSASARHPLGMNWEGRGKFSGVVGPSDAPVESVVVPVFYGTDRRAADDGALHYGGERGEHGELAFGVVDVSVPVDRKVGELPGPRWWRFEFRPDPRKHVFLLDVRRTARDAFVDELRSSLGSADEQDVLVFIHGYNVGFVDAARRAGQLAVDLKFPGRTLLFSWASAASTRCYTVDEATIEWSRPHFEDFLRTALTEIGARTVHVIAHSMGNRALVHALERFDATKLPPGSATLRHVVFAAPDVDAGTFKQLAAAFRGRAERLTLYASTRDVALLASRVVHRYPRAGDAGDRLVVVDGVDTVDASEADTSVGLGHSYFADTRSILSDIYGAVTRGVPPDQRFDLVASASGRHWVYKP